MIPSRVVASLFGLPGRDDRSHHHNCRMPSECGGLAYDQHNVAKTASVEPSSIFLPSLLSAGMNLVMI